MWTQLLRGWGVRIQTQAGAKVGPQQGTPSPAQSFPPAGGTTGFRALPALPEDGGCAGLCVRAECLAAGGGWEWRPAIWGENEERVR